MLRVEAMEVVALKSEHGNLVFGIGDFFALFRSVYACFKCLLRKE